MSTTLEVHIDVPRGGFIKRSDQGSVDFVSPLPCPFNYGHVVGTVAPDGDAEDAIVIGRRLAHGTVVRVAVRGRVGFTDKGVDDSKWICADHELGIVDRLSVHLFFTTYAAIKRAKQRLGGVAGATRYVGWL